MNSSNEGLVERLRDATKEEWKLSMPLGALHLHCDIREAADLIEAQATGIADLKREVEQAKGAFAFADSLLREAIRSGFYAGESWHEQLAEHRAALNQGKD